MSFSSEEIAKIHVVINSGDIPDFSEKMRDAAKSVSQLQEEIQQTQKDLGILAARGDQNSDNFKVMQSHLSKLQTQLKNTNKEMKYYTESIDINLMSSNQLNARSKVLANTLNALSKEAEPDRWNELNNELIKVRRRMDEVRVGSLGVSDSMDITGISMQQLDVYSRQLKASCELLSNLVSLTDCKQQNVSNKHNNRYLRGVCRIKNPAVMPDFLFALSALKEFQLKIVNGWLPLLLF